MNDEMLFEAIKKVVCKIDKKLNELNSTGIFFAPELYIAFCVGKEIYKKRAQIFGSLDIEWVREVAPQKGSGPVDILFKKENKIFCGIELKVRSKKEGYIDDLKKLSSLNIQHKYFCALSDFFEDSNDKRIEDFEGFDKMQNSSLELDKSMKCSFKTWKGAYKKDLMCNLVLYPVK